MIDIKLHDDLHIVAKLIDFRTASNTADHYCIIRTKEEPSPANRNFSRPRPSLGKRSKNKNKRHAERDGT